MEEITETLLMFNTRLDKLDMLDNVLEQVRSVCEEMNEVKKTIAEFKGELYQVMGRQVELDYDLQLLREQPQTAESDNELEEKLDVYINDIHETTEYHQKYLEQVDNDSRRRNLIFHGIPENNTSELGINDMEKVQSVIRETGNSTLLKFKT